MMPAAQARALGERLAGNRPRLLCELEPTDEPGRARCRRCGRLRKIPDGATVDMVEYPCLASADYVANDPQAAAGLAELGPKLQAKVEAYAAAEGQAVPEELAERVATCLGCVHFYAQHLLCTRIRDCDPRAAYYEKLLGFDCVIFSEG
jgi:hypothetical protein